MTFWTRRGQDVSDGDHIKLCQGGSPHFSHGQLRSCINLVHGWAITQESINPVSNALKLSLRVTHQIEIRAIPQPRIDDLGAGAPSVPMSVRFRRSIPGYRCGPLTILLAQLLTIRRLTKQNPSSAKRPDRKASLDYSIRCSARQRPRCSSFSREWIGGGRRGRPDWHNYAWQLQEGKAQPRGHRASGLEM